MIKKQKGFTLIELLVVIGIIAILAVGALIAINPLEAQRKARDSVRLQDLAKLSAAIEAYINDEGIGAYNEDNDSSSHPTGVSLKQQSCNQNFIGVDLCDYIKSVPLDPQNDKDILAITDTTTGRDTKTAGYGFAINRSSGNYKLCTYLESEKSRSLLEDGGLDTEIFEVGQNVGLAAGSGGVTCTP